jgi:hypothetical protein
MRKVQLIPVAKLKIDLSNYRTVPQPDEISAISAMMSIDPAKFWGLMSSLLDHAYEETENLIVIEEGDSYVVKEGNRRAACLKIILGLVSMEVLGLPENRRTEIRKKDNIWKEQIKEVPCVVFTQAEKATVDRIVDRTHGKGEDASRSAWGSVARARHNRANGQTEVGLELLEAYLEKGQNEISTAQRVRWAGDYNVTVLDEFIKLYHRRLGGTSTKEFVAKYPELGEFRKPVEEVIFRIGMEAVGFAHVRGEQLGTYGIEAKQEPANQTSTSSNAGADAKQETSHGSSNFQQNAGAQATMSETPSSDTGQPTGSAASTETENTDATKTRGRNKSLPLTDPKTVKKKLRNFYPRGAGNEKLASLAEEARTLHVDVTPFAFCFLLRSMFEIAAKNYCEKNGIETMDGKNDVKLVTLLGKAIDKISAGSPAAYKELEPAKRELGRPDGLLSVTTMNKLIHCKIMQASQDDICVTFHQIFPLLDHMTR